MTTKFGTCVNYNDLKDCDEPNCNVCFYYSGPLLKIMKRTETEIRVCGECKSGYELNGASECVPKAATDDCPNDNRYNYCTKCHDE